MTPRQLTIPLTVSAVTTASLAAICTSSAGFPRQLAGLSLIGAFACALWFVRRERFDALVPATGLTLVFLILAGLALATAHALNTVNLALTLAVGTLAAIWAGASYSAPRHAGRGGWSKPPNPLATAAVLIFAAVAVLAVRYSADSATADADAASSVAVWAYPSGGQLHVGVQQPAGHGAESVRILVTQADATIAAWNGIRLAPGQTWEAPALTVTGNAPADVTVLRGTTTIASLRPR